MGMQMRAVTVGVICIGLALFITKSPINTIPPPAKRVGVFSSNNRLQGALKLAYGLLPGPEDLALDSQGTLYTACSDGWIKRISFTDISSQVQVDNWTYTGGRPLGIVVGLHGELLVCEPDQGLLNVTRGNVEILSSEADGLKYKLTDGVDVSEEGIVYFTDASYKYGLEQATIDIIEYRPHGRLLKYDPATRSTTVLLNDLYFANGVALSAKQNFLVFCETSLYRCRKYWLEGPKKGSVETFIDGLPGFPDNIRKDGEGNFWIALPTSWSVFGRTVVKYPYLVAVLSRIMPRAIHATTVKESSILCVNEKGEAIALYSDPNVSMITSGMKIGDYLYYGNLYHNYIGRIHLKQN